MAIEERADPNAPDEATQAMFGPVEVHATPASAPAPLFKIGEPVLLPGVAGPPAGGRICAVAWKEEYNSYAYKVDVPKPSRNRYLHAFYKDTIRCSCYTVGDVVFVQAFGQISKRQIEKVHVDAHGNFSYDIEGWYQVRQEYIMGLAGRRR